MTDLVADKLLEALGTSLDYDCTERSFSPCYSDCGLGFDDHAGIAKLYTHYNRRTNALGAPFMRAPGNVSAAEQGPLHVRQTLDQGELLVVGWERNAWVVEASNLEGPLTFHLSDEDFQQQRLQEDDGVWLLDCYMKNHEQRDPDPHVPLCIGLHTCAGSLERRENGIIAVVPDESGKAIVHFQIHILDIDQDGIAEALREAPQDGQQALAHAVIWWRQCVGNLTIASDNDQEWTMLAKAVYTLAFNACEGPGYLAGRVSAFPSRGAYPTHFLWDSCFQNLALEVMDPQLAPDSLLLLTENLRPDGKMAHFLCSTWMRPMDSQPPLVGWAGLRLVNQRDDDALAADLLPALMANSRWWLQQRMTTYGLISCPFPMETGWDDTPRLDHGPILALDMNSYVILQLRACAALAERLGEDDTAAGCEALAASLSQRLIDLCYDPEKNLFYDVLIETGERLDLATPAAFLPLLAGVFADQPEKAHSIIEQHLFDTEQFWGTMPFPSVAYNHETYQPNRHADDNLEAGAGAACWRGPCWLPIAWFMLDVLDTLGFAEKRLEAAQRLYDAILADGELSEYYDSQTGAGIGARQQGWSAAIAIKLYEILNNR